MQNSIAVIRRESAAKKLQSEAARELLRTAERVYASKGKRTDFFDLRHDSPDEATLMGHLLGPTGNLRAPTLMVGHTLIVGFNQDVLRHVLGL